MALNTIIALTALFAGMEMPAEERPFTCQDDMVPGALVRCKTLPATRVTWNGSDVRVSESGEFVFGLGWKETSGKLSLEFMHVLPDGATKMDMSISADPRTYKTEIVNGLPPKTVDVPESWKKRRAEETGRVRKGRAGRTADLHWTADFVRPAEGRISGVYGSHRVLNGQPRSPHYGLDIANKTGTPIVAPASGKVTLAAPDFLLEGGIVIIDHGHGVTSTLFHMNSVDVEEGQMVEQGARIGTIGATGRATGPHVDWRVNWRNVRLDPALLLEEEKG